MGDPTSQSSRLTGEGISPYNCKVAMQVLLPGSYSRLQEDINLMWTLMSFNSVYVKGELSPKTILWLMKADALKRCQLHLFSPCRWCCGEIGQRSTHKEAAIFDHRNPRMP